MIIHKNRGSYIFICLLMGLLMGSCSNKSKQQNQPQTTDSDTDKVKEVTFVLPEIPVTLTDVDARINYLVEHYWDRLDYNDTTLIHNPDVMDQAFVNYLDLLTRVDLAKYGDIIQKHFQSSIQKDSTLAFYNYFQSISKQYLYDPNSPMRNEELYLPIVDFIIKNKIDDEAAKERAKYIRSMLLKNRVGEKVSNLRVKLGNGTFKSIYDAKTDYTILYFYNPDCPQCQKTKTEMVNSVLLGELLKAKDLTILAIYPDDDIKLWESHVSDFPTNWIVTYDYKQAIVNNKLYHLRAIPSLYLLDKEHKVLLKDADFYAVERYLFDALN